MNAADCLKALVLAGRIILENGGETYRAEDTVIRMAKALGLKEADAFAVPSGLFISFTDENGERKTSVSRVHLRGTHLSRVDRVNHLSRRLAGGHIDPETLIEKLEQAQTLGDDLAWWVAPVAAFLSAVGFAVMFGGGPIDMLLGGLCAGLTQLVPYLLHGHDGSGMVTTLLGGVICVIIPLFFQAATGLCIPDAVVAAAIMPLVPGLSMTNAVRDIMSGDMVSGVAHCARALMVAVMVAGGALVATRAFEMAGMPARPIVDSPVMPLWIAVIAMFFSSAVASIGFGALMQVPRRSIGVCGLLGGLGFAAYWLLMNTGTAETAAIFVGALIAALGAQIASKKLKMIATIFIAVPLIPMVPGLGLYRAIRLLAQGQMDAGGSIATHSMALIVMIALGIGLGSALYSLCKKGGKAQ